MNITVYLGASNGNDQNLILAARKLGKWIGENGHTLVYGGSKCGLMGELAESVLKAKGKVIGVEPQFFIDAGFENRAFLTLTGHTHGTQFGIFGKPMITPFKYTRGMYSDGTHCGYVSRGSGGWFSFRFDTSRELTIFTLKKK